MHTLLRNNAYRFFFYSDEGTEPPHHVAKGNAAVDAHPDLGIFLILLNTGGVLKASLSKYPLLRNASGAQLQNYELIGKGTGIHWPDLDEDLSLKSFLRETIRLQVSGDKVA